MSDRNEPIVYVYLAGPITGLSYDEAVDRREELAQPLREAKGVRIVPLSPMRGKKNLARQQVLKSGGYRSPTSTDAAIVARDYNDVQRCYIMVADLLGCTEKSVGTCIEFGLCLAWRKFVVTIMEPGDENPHSHGFIREISSVIVHTREQAIKVILDVIGAEELDEEEEDA